MERLGRFIVILDQDGIRHAVAPFAVAAICEHADGCTILLPGGKHITTGADFQAVAVALSTSPHGSSP